MRTLGCAESSLCLNGQLLQFQKKDKGLKMEKDSFDKRKKVLYDMIHDKHYVPMKTKELAILLNVSKEDRKELQAVLDELVLEGKIGTTKKGKYCKSENIAVIGKFESHPKGFGFVVIEDEPDDVFVSEKDVHGALHNDIVRVAVTREKKDGKRREGKIIQVLERGTDRIVGVFQKSGGFGFVIPDNQRFHTDIYVSGNKSLGAISGHKVIVHITNYGDDKHKPEGEITEIIGHTNDPGTDIMSIVAGYEIPTEFPKEVMDQLKSIPDEIDPNDCVGRMDCREWQTVTIDGEDAKDLDDAISLTEKDGIYTLGVHIADVSHYIQEDSALDKEAIKRGTSVYLVDRVIPMIPHKLSNGVCSLNQGVDRLALSCIMNIDNKGTIVSHKIAETVIRVGRRMSYNGVKQILDQEPNMVEEYRDYVPMFQRMDSLATILREKRHHRGSIDFEFPESKIILDEKGVPIEIKAYDRNTATKIIEDFMLLANETVAEDFYWRELPFMYRTHDNPDPERIQTLGLFINNFGHAIKVLNDEIHPKELQKLLKKIEGTPEEALISRLTLRSMKRAQYSDSCTGHFGLAAKYYTHFTSPIRRYPDLQIHRIIKETLKNGLSEKRVQHYSEILPEIAKNSSILERRSDDAERDVEKLKKTEYMSKKIGQVFEGVISSITSWGIYVELPNTVEGMIHVTALEGDFFFYDADKYEMVGEKSKITYKLGDPLKIKCTGADTIQRTIDFKIMNED